MFIGQHGSWNRGEFSGYKVIFVPFKAGRPAGEPIDVLTGFLKEDGSGKAHGRPVGVAMDGAGALLVADDTGNTVWRVTCRPAPVAGQVIAFGVTLAVSRSSGNDDVKIRSVGRAVAHRMRIYSGQLGWLIRQRDISRRRRAFIGTSNRQRRLCAGAGVPTGAAWQPQR